MKSVAIDQGTTSTRAILFDESGNTTHLYSQEHKQHHPKKGWVEHDPEELLSNIKNCLDVIGRQSDVSCIGIDNQGESCLAWDSQTGKAIYPVIVWQDDRTQNWINQRTDKTTQKLILDRAGLPMDAYFSASKLGWILEHVPDAKKLAAMGRLRLGTTDAFFRDRLCGRFETDVTTASRTSLMNLETCEWDEELCRFFGVPIELLPTITATTGSLGNLKCGKQSIALTASIVDQQAALYGHGCRESGDSKITFGTGAFALMLTGKQLLRNESGTLPTVAWQLFGESPSYALDGGVYAAASAVNWANSIGLFKEYSEINNFTQSSAIISGLVFIPALSGLACPHWDRNARGAWLGLALETKSQDMMQAILEGVAFRMSEVIKAMEQLQSASGVISIDGGMSAYPYVCQFLSNTLNREIALSSQSELTASGTAALSASYIGHTVKRSPPQSIFKPKKHNPDFQKTFSAARLAIESFGSR